MGRHSHGALFSKPGANISAGASIIEGSADLGDYSAFPANYPLFLTAPLVGNGPSASTLAS